MPAADRDTLQSAAASVGNAPSTRPRVAIVGVGGVGCVTARRIAAATRLGLPVTLIDGRLSEDEASPDAPPRESPDLRHPQPRRIALIQPGDRTPFCRIPAEWFCDAASRLSDSLRATLSESDVVVLVTALGGGAGSGAAPVVARLARECDAVVAAAVTLPFRFEGKRRTRTAQIALDEMSGAAHLTLTICGDDLLQRTDRRELTAAAALMMLADELASACETGLGLIGVDVRPIDAAPVAR